MLATWAAGCRASRGREVIWHFQSQPQHPFLLRSPHPSALRPTPSPQGKASKIVGAADTIIIHSSFFILHSHPPEVFL